MLKGFRDRRRIQRILSMLGGFIILVGIVLFGLCALTLFGYLDPSLLLERKQLLIFASAVTVIGLFDMVVGVITARW